MCALGARHAAMKPPSTKPTESAAVTKRELSLFSSTKLPSSSPIMSTAESEKKAPGSHELWFIRCPKNKKSPRKAFFLLLGKRTLN